MSKQRRVLLDPHGDNIPATEYTVVDDQVALVQHALENQSLFVKGEELCRWAEDFGVGRGWQMIWLKSPAQEISEQCPNLSVDEAKVVLNELAGQLADLHRPLQLRDILEVIWGFNGLWEESQPHADHAFRWLAWLSQQTHNGPKLKLLWQQARDWQARSNPLLQRAYGVRSDSEAWSVLKEWLRVEEPQQPWPSVPALPPEGELPQRLQRELAEDAVRSDTDFFVDLLRRAPDKIILAIAAQECASVLLANPQKATLERVHRLTRYLPYDLWQKLIDLVPPQYPGLPQWQFDELTDWFIQKYLPYRGWEVGASGPVGQEWAATSAGEFAHRYLQYYAEARVGGPAEAHLAWAKSVNLRTCDRSYVRVLVVLDGLAYPDSQTLRMHIQRESRRLLLDKETLALAPLPTVTAFAKPAVMKGMVPLAALRDPPQGIYTSPDDVRHALANAIPGDVLVWAQQEPDRTYHFRADGGPIAVRNEVEARLLAIAKQLVTVAEGAPAGLKLSIVITTDHGRLLTNAERTRPIPAGMTAHGRAAWGQCDIKIGEAGYVIQQGIAYLHPGRFGLPDGQGYAVLVSDQTFLTSDGRGGNEPFPHGGLSPEEVLVPWIEFTRDRDPFKVEGTLEGRGEEGKVGRAALTIVNFGPVPITLVELTVDKLGAPVALTDEVEALGQRRIDVSLPKWPSRHDLENLTVHLLYLLPDGQPARCDIQPNLQTESLYDKPDILGEFRGL